MGEGCLLWGLAFGLVWYGEHQQLQALPYAAALATVLGTGLTLWLGSLHGLVTVLRQRGRRQTDPAHWRDGETVRVSGVLWPSGAPVLAPISGQPAVYCTYSGTLPSSDRAMVSQQTPSWRGQLAAPCVLHAGAHQWPVLGIPSLRELPHTIYSDTPHAERAAQHLAATVWTVAPQLALVDIAQLAKGFDEGLAGLPAHLINAAALERLRMIPGQSTPAELLTQLQAHHWQLREHVLPPGAEVTLEGTYRALSHAIDVTYSARTRQHALHVGGEVVTQHRQLKVALLFVLVLGGLTVAAHWVVYAQAGALYLSALRALGLLQ